MSLPSFLIENLKEEHLINISKLDNNINSRRHLKELKKLQNNDFVLKFGQNWYPKAVLEIATYFKYPHLDFESTLSFCTLIHSYTNKYEEAISTEIDLFILQKVSSIKLLSDELKQCCMESVSVLISTEGILDEFSADDVQEVYLSLLKN